MPESKTEKKTNRFHFSAPAADTQLTEWVENQDNLSMSVRLLIKDYIARYGMNDVSSRLSVLI